MNDLQDAIHRGRIGALDAADRADREHSDWKERAALAVTYFSLFIAKGKEFLAEDAREWAERERFVAPPPDSRAWGHIMQALSRNKAIEFAGYGPSRSSNGSPKCLWRVTV